MKKGWNRERTVYTARRTPDGWPSLYPNWLTDEEVAYLDSVEDWYEAHRWDKKYELDEVVQDN